METIDLLTICITAFLAVFGLLALLALVMRLILVFFPDRELDVVTEVEPDAAVIAALTSAISRLYPGTKISNIKELP